MIPIIFFALMCLGPLTVLGNDDSWLPDTVPWPSQQCINHGRAYVGECSVVHNDPTYRNLAFCRSLKCAKLRKFGSGYSLFRLGRPAEGTICGFLRACRLGECVNIDPHRIPTQTGSSTTYECGPPETKNPRARNKNSTIHHRPSGKF